MSSELCRDVLGYVVLGAVNKIKPVSIRAQGRVRERELHFGEIRVNEIFIGDASARRAQ